MKDSSEKRKRLLLIGNNAKRKRNVSICRTCDMKAVKSNTKLQERKEKRVKLC
jgi:hypothetical protein